MCKAGIGKGTIHHPIDRLYLRNQSIVADICVSNSMQTRMPLYQYHDCFDLRVASCVKVKVDHSLLLLVTIYLLLLQCGSYALQDEQKMVMYDIVEGSPKTTIIGDLHQFVSNLLADEYINIEVLGKLHYRINERPKLDPGNLFFVENSSGLVTNTAIIDREAICPGAVDCLLEYRVFVSPPHIFATIKMVINVTDMNDNEPKFPNRTISINISEAASPSKSFSIPPAIDLDSPRYGIKQYKLLKTNVSDKFELKMRQLPDDTTDIQIVLVSPLDREKVDYYELEITAQDSSRPPAIAHCTVKINVIDANDNSPVFERPFYNITRDEGLPKGTVLISVKATDPDLAENGHVEYFFSKHTQQDYGHIFGINPDNGNVYVSGKLDYEESDIYSLQIWAKDGGENTVPTMTNVQVNLRDVNDNEPIIKINTLNPFSKNNEAQVSENSAPGTFVAHISVQDADQGENGVTVCHLENDDFVLQTMLNDYQVLTASVFDREKLTAGYIDVMVKCRDGGIPHRFTSSILRVNILDENDHSPVFYPSNYSVSIVENNHVGDFILSVTARDPDEAENGYIHFSIIDDPNNYFTIDEVTGWITTNVVFDHEKVKQVKFKVLASDKARKTRTSSAPVLVEILDQDDEYPVFEQPRYSFSVFENAEAGTHVGKVHAVDKDSTPNNRFYYSLGSGSPTHLFQVERDGNIYTRRKLDRENQPAYYFVIIAHGEDPMKTSSASISVFINDLNDNIPTFEFPTETNNSIHVSNQAPTGHVIARFRARDTDAGKNGRLTFFIYRGNEDEYFKLDQSRGTLTINRDLSQLEKKLFILHISVQDDGDNLLKSNTQLNIIINNALGYQTSKSTRAISRSNVVILIIFAIVTIIVSAIIIAIIIFIRRRDQPNEDEDAHKEREKMLPQVSKVGNDGSGSSGKTPPVVNNYETSALLGGNTKSTPLRTVTNSTFKTNKAQSADDEPSNGMTNHVSSRNHVTQDKVHQLYEGSSQEQYIPPKLNSCLKQNAEKKEVHLTFEPNDPKHVADIGAPPSNSHSDGKTNIHANQFTNHDIPKKTSTRHPKNGQSRIAHENIQRNESHPPEKVKRKPKQDAMHGSVVSAGVIQSQSPHRDQRNSRREGKPHANEPWSYTGDVSNKPKPYPRNNSCGVWNPSTGGSKGYVDLPQPHCYAGYDDENSSDNISPVSAPESLASGVAFGEFHPNNLVHERAPHLARGHYIGQSYDQLHKNFEPDMFHYKETRTNNAVQPYQTLPSRNAPIIPKDFLYHQGPLMPVRNHDPHSIHDHSRLISSRCGYFEHKLPKPRSDLVTSGLINKSASYGRIPSQFTVPPSFNEAKYFDVTLRRSSADHRRPARDRTTNV